MKKTHPSPFEETSILDELEEIFRDVDMELLDQLPRWMFT